jgi:hypothetical protein
MVSLNASPHLFIRKYFSIGSHCNKKIQESIDIPVIYPQKIKGIFFK